MKRFLLGIVMFLALNTALAFDVCMTGSWYSPDRDGEGVSLEVFDDGRVVGYFYTFGYTGHRWLTLHGRDYGEGGFVLDMKESISRGYHYSVGEAVITEIDENTFQFTFHTRFELSREKSIPWCFSNACSGDYTYIRLTQPIQCEV